MSKVIIFIVFLTSQAALPKEEAIQNFGGRTEMNGIKLSDYADFEEKWKLVTVRYREDSGEMRWTYANEAAWKTLSSGGAKYSDGAVFAKVGIKTDADPAFTSSRVPSGARRTQFMVYDKKKYKDTNAWGYALFNQSGVTFPEDPKLAQTACHACHRLVPDRDYVFSQIPTQNDWKPQSAIPTYFKSDVDLSKKLVFKDETRVFIPGPASRGLPEKFKSVRRLTGDLEKHMFDGTSDEIRPSLAVEANRSQGPAILVSQDRTQYSIVYPFEETTEITCSSGQKKFASVNSLRLASLRTREDNSAKEAIVRTALFCMNVTAPASPKKPGS